MNIIYDSILYENKLLAEDAAEIIEFLYYLQKIRINCNTFQNELFKALKNKLPHNACLQNPLNWNTENMNNVRDILEEYSEKALPQYILNNKITYVEKMTKVTQNSEDIPKFVLPIIISDFEYSECIASNLSLNFSINILYEKTPINFIDDFIKIVDDYRWNKKYNANLIDKLIKRLIDDISLDKGYIKTPDLLLIITTLLSISDELFRFNLTEQNILVLDHLKNELVEEILE